MITLDSLPLSLTDWVVLALIDENSRHGFAISCELRPNSSVGKVWRVNRALVYRSIDHLEEIGLISRIRTEPGEKGPERTVFKTTRQGHAMLSKWLDAPVQHPRDVRNELMVKFTLLARRAWPLRPLAERQLAQFEPVVAGMHASAPLDATNAERIVSTWRLESMGATIQTLKRIAAQEFDLDNA